MTPKKNYSRYFIILQEDEKGYSLDSDKIPSGYAKLEMKNNKCKISYYVQNLRKEKQPYYMILICGKKDVNKIIKLGKLNIDDYGRVDISNEYDIENIADTGISAEKVIGAAIVKFLDTNVVSIMSGFSTTDKPNEWKRYKLAEVNKEKNEIKTDNIINEFDEYEQSIELIKTKNDEVIESLECQKNVDNEQSENIARSDGLEEEIKVKEPDEVIESLKSQKNVDEEVDIDQTENIARSDGLEEEIKVKEPDEVIESLKSQKNVDEEVDIDQRENIEKSDGLEEEIKVKEPNNEFDENRKKDKKQDKEDNCNDKQNYYDKGEYPKGNIGDFFKTVAQGFHEVPNFSDEIKWCKWYKVPVSNLDNMYDFSDYNKCAIAYYPMICYYPYIKNYKHFMLGYKCDSTGKMKYIVYGIPGSRSKAHQPYGGKTGFVTWIADSKNDEMGHWLMFYDFKKSTIVIPLKK